MKDLHIKLDLKEYQGYLFFFKEDVFWMCYAWESKYLWYREEILQRVNTLEVQTFIKQHLEGHFKVKDIIPYCLYKHTLIWARGHMMLSLSQAEKHFSNEHL